MKCEPCSLGCTISDEDHQIQMDRAKQNTFQAFLPKPKLTVVEWADQYRFIAKGTSAKAKDADTHYRSDFAPHQVKPQQMMTEKGCQVVVLMMASQIGGKTELCNNLLGYHIHWKATSSIIMYPTIDSAEKYSKKKFTPMINATPVLMGLIAPARSRDSGNTILVKEFPGGSVFFIGANSPAALRQATGEVLIADEIDTYEDSAGLEGDPVELLFKRGESFPNCVKVLASTPTIKGYSRIEKWFGESDQQYWFVPCPLCGNYQTLTWNQVKWPVGKPEEARLICEHCAAELTDEQRLQMYHSGEWRATAPFKGIAGFHLNGIYCPWPAQKGYANRLHQMAVEFERAEKSGPSARKVWVNTFKVESYDDASEHIPGEVIYNRREIYGPELPEQVLALSGGADVQADRIEAEVIGWGLSDESWGIEHKIIMGSPLLDDPWRQLEAFFRGPFKHPKWGDMKVRCAFIDAGYLTTRVFRFTKAHEREMIFACKGMDGPRDIAPRKLSRNNSFRAGLAVVGVDTAKDELYERLKILDAGPRYMHFPESYALQYFQQLTSHRAQRVIHRGRIIRRWKKAAPGDRDEALDIRIYAMAAWRFCGAKPEDVLKKLEKDLQEGKLMTGTSKSNADTNRPAQPTVSRISGRPRGAFVRGWRNF